MGQTSMWSSAASSRRAAARASACVLVVLACATVFPGTPRFYPDDPIWVDDDMSLDASGAVAIEDPTTYDFVVNTFRDSGERRNVRALNVNTVDEVPDSSWFTNRVGQRDLTPAELVRGPDRFESVSLEGWVISAGKPLGAQPGFRMKDPTGHTYQIEFDPPSNPEMATCAETISTAFFHAIGYNVVDVYLGELDPAKLAISPTATVYDQQLGKKRRLIRRDIDLLLRRAARRPDGKYQVLASRFAEGKPLGNFRYYGTRPDDPNDIFLHEHRRELRGARVFFAWLNHDDSSSPNSLDFLVGEEGRRHIRHYMFDFGSTLGSDTSVPQHYRAGNEYLLDWTPGWLTLATLGIYTQPWLRIRYPSVPAAVGRFEGDRFDPEAWRPEYENPAFENMRPDDAFWAARIVGRFSDQAIRAIVGKAKYTDPRATEYITATLIKRRDKVLKTWLTGVNPLADFALSAGGELTFVNSAVNAGVATPASGHRIAWARFDNATGEAARVGADVTTAELRAQMPPELAAGGESLSFVQVQVAAIHPGFPAWEKPVTVHFRRVADRWKLVGLTRLPD
jgi:hypothetical protein